MAPDFFLMQQETLPIELKRKDTRYQLIATNVKFEPNVISPTQRISISFWLYAGHKLLIHYMNKVMLN